ncbi:Mg chelatase-like protein [Bifidobacterium saguini DSM 23967]|uniref:Mg chelatase-like protein n=1 Tax=Bifidobacterium saguini DSM 23967 TaxID=1437607 RepID=A0A087D3S6_9BIFI|nr:magnesium chelatase domain-containing protein [Bifidobacterium saguini]KFI90176.1 Mg chelatase-like protein [Bifidobacterium saguini DSM 23967]
MTANGTVNTLGLIPYMVKVEAYITPGLPYFSIIGVPDASLSPLREQIRNAVESTGRTWPQQRVTVNLSPASIPKQGSQIALPIALAVIHAMEGQPESAEETCVLGGIDANGNVTPITNLTPMLDYCRNHGIDSIITPKTNHEETTHTGIDAHEVETLEEAIAKIKTITSPEQGTGTQPAVR